MSTKSSTGGVTTPTTKFNSPTASATSKKTYTRPQAKLMARLNQEHIAFLSEHPLEREGEVRENGQPKSWVIDIFIPPDLCVEVDGKVHVKAGVRKRDEEKERWLDLHGYILRRFGNFQVDRKMDDVIRLIREAMAA